MQHRPKHRCRADDGQHDIEALQGRASVQAEVGSGHARCRNGQNDAEVIELKEATCDLLRVGIGAVEECL